MKSNKPSKYETGEWSRKDQPTQAKPEHTPTPLTIREGHMQGVPVYEIATKFMDRKDAEAVVRAVNAYAKIEKVVSAIASKNKEDATDYFLRAVNSHEELLDIAKRLLADDDVEDSELVEAIAKAEGK